MIVGSSWWFSMVFLDGFGSFVVLGGSWSFLVVLCGSQCL